LELERLDTELLKEISEKVGASPEELLQTERLVVPIAIFQSLLLRHLIEVKALKLGKVKEEYVGTDKINLNECKRLLRELVSGNEEEYAKAGIDEESFVKFADMFKDPPSDADLVPGGHSGCNFSLGCPTRLQEIRDQYNIEFQKGHTIARRWYSPGRDAEFTQDECWLHNEMKATSPLMDINNLVYLVFGDKEILSEEEEEVLFEKEP